MMLEKGKISAFQMGLLMYPTVLATGFLTLPTVTAQYAENDLWLTGIFASLLGFIMVYTTIRLHELYPKQTVIEYSARIVGRIPGKIIGVLFFLFFLHVTGVMLRQYAEFVTGNYLLKTPMLLVISSMILLAAFAVRGGAEMIARCAVIFTPFFILPLFFLVLLVPNLDIKNIFPILSNGLIPVIKGTLTPQAWLCEFFLMSFFLPSLSNPEKGRKWGLISLCAVIISMIYVNLITLFLLGPYTGNKIYPILVAFRYISFADFLSNLEALLLAMWIVGNFVKISVFYYVASLSFGQTFKLTDYRPVVFLIGIFIVIFSLWDLPNFTVLGIYLRNVAPFELTLFLALIPLFLLFVAIVRKPKETSS
jgi:spore germination protein KB